jgi:3D (Asp-Asp-Asp) domain-containing protein
MPSASQARKRVAPFVIGLGALAVWASGCGSSTTDGDAFGATHDELRVTSSFTTKGTGYFPDKSALEGGFKDRLGKPLRTLQAFLAGDAEYVSVAMDSKAFKYGTRLRVKELDAKFGRSITFRVVDTGGAFKNKGRTRMDICTANEKASLDPTINGPVLHVDVMDETGDNAAPDPSPMPDPVDDPTGNDDPAPAPPGRVPTPNDGKACSFDGACNPGVNGSGLICASGVCVPGCRQKNQCPGAQSCVDGQCQ